MINPRLGGMAPPAIKTVGAGDRRPRRVPRVQAHPRPRCIQRKAGWDNKLDRWSANKPLGSASPHGGNLAGESLNPPVRYRGPRSLRLDDPLPGSRTNLRSGSDRLPPRNKQKADTGAREIREPSRILMEEKASSDARSRNPNHYVASAAMSSEGTKESRQTNGGGLRRPRLGRAGVQESARHRARR